MGALSRRVFGISIEETRFERRGFRGGDPRARRRLETIGAAFLSGYHAALADHRIARLAASLESVDVELRGFAYEGAAMGLSLLDTLTPWRRDRWATFLAGPGERHAYMVHVGAGWARARLGGDPDRFLERHDPLLGWLVLDGWGFHDGYFDWPRTIGERRAPPRLIGYARRAYDQGLGRAAWFVDGAEVERVAATLASFEASRREDLWSGVGLAAAYAGGAEESALQDLRERAGEHGAALAQGAAFAAQARRRAGNPAPHTDLACRILCGMGADQAAETTTEALRGLPAGGPRPAYETWRRRIQERFAREWVAA